MGTHELSKGHDRWRDWLLDSQSDRLSPDDAARLQETPFLRTARLCQRAPQGDWRTWLFMGGRGAGKTRAGAEWARFAVQQAGLGRLALVGPTLSDVREVMIEGPSGLKAVASGCDEDVPVYQVSRRRLEWANGALAYVFSAEDPDSLRGPQFDGAWCDEAAAWRRGPMVWDMLQMALRIGDSPRAVVTTTPKPVPLIKRLVSAPDAVVTRGKTWDNADNLAKHFLSSVEAAYGGSRLGRQELDGVLLDDHTGALWTKEMIDRCAVTAAPDAFHEVIVAVDPPVTSGAMADECGIVAVGSVRAPGAEVECFVLADASAGGLSPLGWATRAVALADEIGADKIIAETNQGGEMVLQTLYAAGCTIPVTSTRARISKGARASPVSILYEQMRVKHVGRFPMLEEQMILFGTDGQTRSPDRVDALVWAVASLALDDQGHPQIRQL